MSLADNYKTLSYTSDGVQTDFPILWRFFDKDTVLAKVYRDGILEKELSYGQDYSVTPTGETGGILTLSSPVDAGRVLAISRKEPYVQLLELLNSGKFDLAKLEEALDHIVMLSQQNRDDLGRGLQVPPGSPLTPEEFILDLLKKYEEVISESSLIKTALGNFFCSAITPFTTVAGQFEYEVGSDIPLDPLLNNLFLVLGGVAQEPVTSFVIVDASHIRFTSDPGDGLRCWGVTSLSMSSPDIRLVVEAAIQKIVAEGDKQADRAKEFAQAAAQSASEAAEDAKDVAADKEHVDTVAGQLYGLKIVVNTLNPGEQATASYDPSTGILTLGVPKGDSGAAAIATPTSLGSVMPQTGDEDGLELETDGKLRVRKASASQRGGVLASTTAAANTVPQAGEDGTLDESWVPKAEAFPAGTQMLFVQAAAPTGWTKQTTVNDAAIRIVSGTTGGKTGGSVAFSTAFVAGKAITLSGNVGATTLSTSNMPSHKHNILYGEGTGSNIYRLDGSRSYYSSTRAVDGTTNVGGNGSHTHSLSGTATVDLSVKYVDTILCKKA